MDALVVANDHSTEARAEKAGPIGQFLTPAPVAAFMAGLFGDLPRDIRLLDAGAGQGSLTEAFVAEACGREDKPVSISATAFEADGNILPQLRAAMETCARVCTAAGVRFEHQIIHDDYIVRSSDSLTEGRGLEDAFDFVILNPPYAKINSSSIWRRALRVMGIETSNLYTAFVAVALKHVKAGGQMVAITPRSFCNGTYFASFRRQLLDDAALEHIHLYGSRRKAFAEDAVLQENIIFRITKGAPQPDAVCLSTSDGPGAELMQRWVPSTEVVAPKDCQRFIRLPMTAEHSALADKVSALPATLSDLGIKVSTGRVVDFRAREHLRKLPESGAVPLIYPMHLNGGGVAWPKPDGRKSNALALNDATMNLVVPSGTYVLAKRFTSKEEKRRLVAVVYDPEVVQAEYVGFENHLNYFHESGRGLPVALARGVALFLNSTAVDDFFRQFSGHTQVNATDIRNMHFPDRAALERLGDLAERVWPDQASIDAAVEALL